jgi:hypothetical protein
VATDHFKEQSQGMPSRAVKGIWDLISSMIKEIETQQPKSTKQDYQTLHCNYQWQQPQKSISWCVHTRAHTHTRQGAEVIWACGSCRVHQYKHLNPWRLFLFKDIVRSAANIHHTGISQTNQSVDYVAVCLQPPGTANVDICPPWEGQRICSRRAHFVTAHVEWRQKGLSATDTKYNTTWAPSHQREGLITFTFLKFLSP